MNYDPNIRLAEPGEDDLRVERIEVEFALPVFLTGKQQERLAALIQEICKAPMNTPANGLHWQSGIGSKPQWSQADALLLGKPVDPKSPATGEPKFDDAVLHFETSAREASRKELSSYGRKL